MASPPFDKCSKEQKLVLLALKTQLTFKEAAEIWSSRYYRCTPKYLSRAYKKLKRQHPPNELSPTRNELERLQVIASPDDWMPDERVIFMLLIWQNGTTRPWQMISDAFNERFHSNLTSFTLSRFALRYLHDKNSSDYLLKTRARSSNLTNAEAFPLALKIAAMHVTTWTVSWLSPLLKEMQKPRSSSAARAPREDETWAQAIAKEESPSIPGPPSLAQTLWSDETQTRAVLAEETPSTPESLPSTIRPMATLLLPSTIPASQNAVKGSTAEAAVTGTHQADRNRLLPAPATQVVNYNLYYLNTAEALAISKARLRTRLGLFLSTLYDYTDLTWEEIIRVCPLGLNWNWVRNDGGAFTSWRECGRALMQIMLESKTPFPATDMLWASAFLNAHAEGRLMFPDPNPRVLARLETQMALYVGMDMDELLD